MTADLVAKYHHPASLQPFAMGGYMRLESGHEPLGWRSQPAITEHDGNDVVMGIQTGG